MTIEEAVMARFGEVETQGDELYVECPECGHRKLAINARTGAYHCWVCEVRGCVLSRRDTLLQGRRCAPGPVRERRGEKKAVAPVMPDIDEGAGCMDLPQAAEEVPEEWAEAESYLRGRLRADEADDIISDMADVWRAQYIPMAKGREFGGGVLRTGGTLCFPVNNCAGHPVGWQCRLLCDPDRLAPDEAVRRGLYVEAGKVLTPKYFTAPGWNKALHWYGGDVAIKGSGVPGDRRPRLCVLVEGVFDVFAVGPAGVCGFGKTVTEDQLKLLRLLFGGGCIAVMLDPDAADEQRRLLDMMARLNSEATLADDHVAAFGVSLEGYKDAGAAGRKETWQAIDTSARLAGVDLGAYSFVRPAGC